MEEPRRAVVVLSGGQDSTTCLFFAIREYGKANVSAVTFWYNQRHQTEVAAARRIAEMAGVQHTVVDLRGFADVSESSLTRKDVGVSDCGGIHGLPSTFTPSRNLVFATVASALVVGRKGGTLVMGVCQTDYSGYPDCREEAIKAIEKAIQLGNDCPGFAIWTPLMFMTKAQSVLLARELPGCWDALKISVTCYNGGVPGCGECPSCRLRAKGFEEAGLADPARGFDQ